MSNARRDKTEEWDMRPRPEPDYTALAERLARLTYPSPLEESSLAAIRDLQERLAQALDEIDECRIDIRTLAEDKAAAERQRDDAVEALRKALLWTDEENDVGPWREEASAALSKAGAVDE